MQIIYTCPRCGHDLREVMLTCDPPINRKECFNCGWFHEDPRDDVVRIPFSEKKDNVVDYGNGLWAETNMVTIKDPCTNCPNRPEDGNISVCHCTLGLPQVYC